LVLPSAFDARCLSAIKRLLPPLASCWASAAALGVGCGHTDWRSATKFQVANGGSRASNARHAPTNQRNRTYFTSGSIGGRAPQSGRNRLWFWRNHDRAFDCSRFESAKQKRRRFNVGTRHLVDDPGKHGAG